MVLLKPWESPENNEQDLTEKRILWMIAIDAADSLDRYDW